MNQGSDQEPGPPPAWSDVGTGAESVEDWLTRRLSQAAPSELPHYPGDVAVGAVTGAVIGRATAAVAGRLGQPT